MSYRDYVLSLGPASYWELGESSGDALDTMPHQPYAAKVLAHAATDNGTYAAAVLALAGLQSYWKFGEASGNALDSGPANVPGTVGAGAVRAVPPLINPSRAAGDKALRLTLGPVNFGATAHRLAGLQPFWIRRIVKLDVGSGANELGCAGGTLPAVSGWEFHIAAPTVGVRAIQCQRRSGAVQTIVQATVPDDGLPHVVDWYFDGTKQVLFVDGSIVATVADTTSLVASTTGLSLNGIGGDQDDTFICTTVASDQAIGDLYRTAISERYSGGVSSYWRLGELAGPSTDSGPAGISSLTFGLDTEMPSIITPAQAGGNLACGGPGAAIYGQVYRFAGREPFTVEQWISRGSVGQQWIGKSTLSIADEGWLLGTNTSVPTGDLIFQRSDGVAADIIGLGVPFQYLAPENERLHLVGTYDGATMILYAQGVEVGRTASVINIPFHSSNLRLSLDANGRADEVAIYPGLALTPEQVQEHFTYGSSKIGDCDATVNGSVARNVQTLVNPANSTTGAVRLNNTSGRLAAGNEAYRFAGRQPFSIAAILKAEGALGKIGSHPNDATSPGARLFYDDVIQTAGFAVGTTVVDTVCATRPLSIIGVCDGEFLAICVDGLMRASVPLAQPNPLSYAEGFDIECEVGAGGTGPVTFDDTAVFLRALDLGEIEQLYARAAAVVTAGSASAAGTSNCTATGQAVASQTTVSAVGSAAGVGAAVANSQQTLPPPGVVSGTAVTTGTGAATAVGQGEVVLRPGVATVSGTGQATANGQALTTAAASGRADGTSAAAASSATASSSAVAQSSGTASAQASGDRAGEPADARSDGTSVATASSQQTAPPAGTVEGTGVSSGVGAATAVSPGTPTGIASATGVAAGNGIAQAVAPQQSDVGVGVSQGAGTATATSAPLTGSGARADGTSMVLASGEPTTALPGERLAVAIAQGAGTAAATSEQRVIRSGAGRADGTGSAQASFNAPTVEGIGNSTGIGLASAQTPVIRESSGSAEGSGQAAATGTNALTPDTSTPGIGIASGNGEAQATSAQPTAQSAVATAAGTGAAAASNGSAATPSGVGTSAGSAVAAATGTTLLPSSASAAGIGQAAAVGSTASEVAVSGIIRYLSVGIWGTEPGNTPGPPGPPGPPGATPEYRTVRVVANYDVQASDGLILVDASAGPVVINLRDASEAGAHTVTIKRISTNANAVTLRAVNGTGQTVDGVSEVDITTGRLGNMTALEVTPEAGIGWWIT